MIQAQTQTAAYWGQEFSLTEADVEQIYNHFLETERPQTIDQIVRMVMAYRIQEETNQIERQLSGRRLYQPKASYKVGDKLVFPAMKFAHGSVTAVRQGHNPEYGAFNVIEVDLNGKVREFVSDLRVEHVLNVTDNQTLISQYVRIDVDTIYEKYHYLVSEKIAQSLQQNSELVRLAHEWFVKSLMAEVNIGHLHLAEAVLEMSDGGPLPPEEIIPHLDMDPSVHADVQRFSLNYGLLKDKRFDEIAPRGKVLWFLNRLEPDGVKETPERLRYPAIPYDRALLSPQLLTLEREIDDEWSELQSISNNQTVLITLNYPHRVTGTLPLNASIRPMFPPSISPRQRVIFIDDETGAEIVGWVVQEPRYVYGLKEWYEQCDMPVGAYIHLKAGPAPGKIILGYDRRRPRREWVRLATAQNNQLKFELDRRPVAGGYDDLMIVGTDVPAAVDALWRRAETNRRPLVSLMAEIFPELAALNPQNTVHTKTLYSALNMLKRVPPGPIFAELIRHPAFQTVGDHYWRFDQSRWQSSY